MVRLCNIIQSIYSTHHLMQGCVYSFWWVWLRLAEIIGPILDDRLKEKIPKPWKGALSSHSVCLSVCPCVRKQSAGHIFLPRKLIFVLNDPCDMRKKRIFLFFEIFIFTLFIGIFRFFPYITLVNFGFQTTGHSFSPRAVIFGFIGPFTIRK